MTKHKLAHLIRIEVMAVVVVIVAVSVYVVSVRPSAVANVLPANILVSGNDGNVIQSVSYTPSVGAGAMVTSMPAYTLEYASGGGAGWFITAYKTAGGDTHRGVRIPANNALVEKVLRDVVDLKSEGSTPIDEVGDEYFLKDFLPQMADGVDDSNNDSNNDDAPLSVTREGHPSKLTIVTRNGARHVLEFGSAIREQSSHFQGFMYVKYGDRVHIVTTNLYQIIPDTAEQVASQRVYDIVMDSMEFWAVNVGDLQYSLVYSHVGGDEEGFLSERGGVWILNSKVVLQADESRRVFANIAPLDAFRVYSLDGRFPQECSALGLGATPTTLTPTTGNAVSGSMVVVQGTESAGITDTLLPICQVGIFYYIQNPLGYVYEVDSYPFAELESYD